MKVGQISHEKAIDFILGGKAFVTFQNPASGNRYTYKVVKHKLDDIYFVNVLTVLIHISSSDQLRIMYLDIPKILKLHSILGL